MHCMCAILDFSMHGVDPGIPVHLSMHGYFGCDTAQPIQPYTVLYIRCKVSDVNGNNYLILSTYRVLPICTGDCHHRYANPKMTLGLTVSSITVYKYR